MTLADRRGNPTDLEVKVLVIIAGSIVDTKVVSLIIDSIITAVNRVVRGTVLSGVRMVKTDKPGLKCIISQNHDNWDRFLHEFSFALRAAVNETTGKTPAELFLGRKIITHFRKLVLGTDGAKYVGGNIEKLLDEARQNMQRQHKMWEKYYNRKRRTVNIKVNDLVLVQTHFIRAVGRRVVGKFMPKFEAPYRVLAVQNNNLTLWKRGRRVTVNVDQVRIYHPKISSYDSINETTYKGKESSNWSNRSNSEKSRRSRKPSVNENKSCKSERGNAGLEYLRVKQNRTLELTGTSERYDRKRPKICRKRSCRGSDYEQQRKRKEPVQPKEPLQRTRRTTGGAEEYEDRQSLPQNSLRRRSLSVEALDGDPADRST
ncbi:uncharacterized protein TNCV_636271 [Trichonephila clavipes]|nr:uncharacterized protein TNCV_636271 [Trichonephila clavipes]